MNPMVFNFPGLGLDAPMMGILLDLEKMFPMVGTMAMVDADSNNGSCCCNAAGYFVLSYLPKDGKPQKTGLSNNDVPMVVQKALGEKYDPTANYYIAGDRNMMNGTPAWIPGTAPTVCDACPNTSIPATGADYLCQVNQAGAGVNTWDMLLGWPDSKELETCFYVKGNPKYAYKDQPNATDDNVDPVLAKNLMETWGFKELPVGPMLEIAYLKPSCKTCNQPNLCVMQAPDGGAKSKVIAPFATSDGPITGALIGADGMGYFDQYMGSLIYPETKKTGNGYAGKWLNLPSVAVRQCKFQVKDWDKWVEVQKEFYRNVLLMQDPTSNTFFKKDGTVHPYQQMYNANPLQGQYFEHEVNIYVDPDPTSAFHKQQQQRFQDSIIGFFYTCQTCEDSMEELKNVETPSLITTNLAEKDWFSHGSFKSPSARCDGYFTSAPNPGTRIIGDTRRAAEAQKQTQMRLSTLELCRLFGEKYGRDIMPLKAKMHSNAFIGNAQTARSLEEKLQFSEIFELIEPTATDKTQQKAWQTAMRANRGSTLPPYTGAGLTTMVQASLAALVKIVAGEVKGPSLDISNFNSAKLRRQARQNF
jgi:hypothetical protein